MAGDGKASCDEEWEGGIEGEGARAEADAVADIGADGDTETETDREEEAVTTGGCAGSITVSS